MHNSELRLHLNCAFNNPCGFTRGVQTTFSVMILFIAMYKSLSIYLSLSLYIYIYIRFFLVLPLICHNMMKPNCLECSYIRNFTLNLIEILKIRISNRKHTRHTKLDSQEYMFSKNHLFQRLGVQQNLNFMIVCMVLLTFYSFHQYRS